MRITYRATPDPEGARNCGWTKNHHRIECYIGDKWRLMAYAIPNRIDFKEIARKIRTNAGLTQTAIITFVPAA
jgi:hypothetical protein